MIGAKNKPTSPIALLRNRHPSHVLQTQQRVTNAILPLARELQKFELFCDANAVAGPFDPPIVSGGEAHTEMGIELSCQDNIHNANSAHLVPYNGRISSVANNLMQRTAYVGVKVWGSVGKIFNTEAFEPIRKTLFSSPSQLMEVAGNFSTALVLANLQPSTTNPFINYSAVVPFSLSLANATGEIVLYNFPINQTSTNNLVNFLFQILKPDGSSSSSSSSSSTGMPPDSSSSSTGMPPDFSSSSTGMPPDSSSSSTGMPPDFSSSSTGMPPDFSSTGYNFSSSSTGIAPNNSTDSDMRGANTNYAVIIGFVSALIFLLGASIYFVCTKKHGYRLRGVCDDLCTKKADPSRRSEDDDDDYKKMGVDDQKERDDIEMERAEVETTDL